MMLHRSMLWHTYDVMEGSEGGVFWRDAVVGIEDPQLGRVLEWMFLEAQHIEQAAQCLYVKVKHVVRSGIQDY